MYGRYTRGWVGGWVDALMASPYVLRNYATTPQSAQHDSRPRAYVPCRSISLTCRMGLSQPLLQLPQNVFVRANQTSLNIRKMHATSTKESSVQRVGESMDKLICWPHVDKPKHVPTGYRCAWR